MPISLLRRVKSSVTRFSSNLTKLMPLPPHENSSREVQANTESSHATRPPVAGMIDIESAPNQRTVSAEEGEAEGDCRQKRDDKRRRRGGESTSDDDTDDDFSRKKPVSTKHLPWSGGQTFARRQKVNDPILDDINELFAIWNDGLKGTSRYVIQNLYNQPNRPPFPDSEWENIIKGRAVNLDNVFSRYHTDYMPNTVSSSIGEIKLVLEDQPIRKRIVTQAEW